MKRVDELDLEIKCDSKGYLLALNQKCIMGLFSIRRGGTVPMVISSMLVVATISSPLSLIGMLTTKTANAKANSNNPTITSSHIDSSPLVAVFVITKDNQGNLIFLPKSAAIKPGEEIFVLNNETKPHTVLNGNGPDDSLSGKPFSIGAVKPKAFLEYRASNLPDGISFLFAI